MKESRHGSDSSVGQSKGLKILVSVGWESFQTQKCRFRGYWVGVKSISHVIATRILSLANPRQRRRVSLLLKRLRDHLIQAIQDGFILRFLASHNFSKNRAKYSINRNFNPCGGPFGCSTPLTELPLARRKRMSTRFFSSLWAEADSPTSIF